MDGTETEGRSRAKAITPGAVMGNVLVNHVGVLVAAAVGFFLTPFVLRSVGHSSFGIYTLSLAMLDYAQLLDFGLGLSVMKLIADRVHRTDQSETRAIFATVLLLYLGIGTAILVVGLAVLPLIQHDFHVAAGQLPAFRWCYVIATVTIGITFPQSVFTASLTGHRDFHISSGFTLANAIVSAGLIVFFVDTGRGVVAIALISLATAVAGFAAKVVIVRYRYGLGFSRRHVERRMLSTVFSFATWVFLMNVAAQLIFDTDTVVVGVILGPLSVAAYQIALSPSAVLRQLADQFNVVALTTSSSLHAQGEESTVQRLLLESTRVTLVVMLPFVVVFSAWGTDFVRLWVGNGFRHSVPSLICLSTAMVLIAMQGTAAQVIMAHSRHRVIAIATSCEAIANLALSIVLGLHIGITGVALGTLIPTAFTALFVSMPYAARLAGVSMWRIFARLLPPIAGALALVWVCRQIDHAWHPFTTMVSLFATSAVLFGLFVAANLLGYRPERRTYLDLLSRPFRRA